MDSLEKSASDVSEANFTNELEGSQCSAEDVNGEVPMETTDDTEQKEVNENGKNQDTAVEDSRSEKACEEKQLDSRTKEIDFAAVEGISPKKVSSSGDDSEVAGGVSPRKADAAKPVSPASKSITIVMSPTSSGQKTQTLRVISQEQMASLPVHTIQLPLKSSPIVLKATTIPMPTKTVSIVAKPSTSASPVRASTAVVVSSNSKMPNKAVSVNKGVTGGEKRESASSSSKSESSLHKKVKPGGVTKAKMQSARVIVVPLQITKEMIAAKQKAAKMEKSGSDEATKRLRELNSKSESADDDEVNEVSSAKGKSIAKQVKKSAVAKKTEDDDSNSQSKGSGKESKKLGSSESENETDDVQSEATSPDKSQKTSKNVKDRTAGIEQISNKTSGKQAKNDEEETDNLEAGEKEVLKVGKMVKGRIRKNEKNSDDSDETEVKSKEKVRRKEESEDESESEVDGGSNAKIGKRTMPKKTKTKEEDEEEEAEAYSESDAKSKTKGVAAKKSQGKNESDIELKDTSEAEAKQDDDDDSVVKSAKRRKTKKVKEEENEGDSENEGKKVETKKTPGRPRKSKEEPTPRTKPTEEPVLSTRRSKRESNLSMKLAEWGLLPVATPKSSYSKPATPKSPVASRAATVSKHSAAAAAAAKSSIASRSPVAADSPLVSGEDVSPPNSPEKPISGVTVTVIKPGSDSTPAAVESDAGSQPSKTSVAKGNDATETPSAVPSTERSDEASSVLSSSNVSKVPPKPTPKVSVKAEKSTSGPSTKQPPKVTQEKTIISKPIIEVKQMQNKSLMCKPIMMTKATSCNPIRIHKITQTEVTEADRKKKTVFVPVPVPIALPSPVATCAMPTPFPLPLPVPLPVPCFIPTSRKSIDGIMKSLQELHDQMPSDPFEVDLLTMADAVATAHAEVPDCVFESEEIKPVVKVDPTIGVAATTLLHQTSGGELSEDVLGLALRMAQEMPEEGSVELEALKERLASHPEASHTTEFGSVIRNSGIQHKRPAGDSERGSYKRARIEGGGGGLAIPAAAVAFAKGLPMKDSHMKLKYSCGVRAWKQWVKEKNVELEKAAAALKVQSKLFKQEILQCSTEELNLALSLFVGEVRKPMGEEYAPDSVYYLCLGIQYYLYENGRVDNIFSDVYYKGFSDSLNNLLSTFQIRLNPQGIICRITEEHLWESRQLGAHSPYILLSTLVYLNTKYFMLNSTDAHLALTFPNIVKQFRKNGISADAKQSRTAFLRYNAAAFTDANRQSGIEPPVNPSEQLENVDNPLRCPVRLYEFYLSKCPENIRSRSELFYLTPEISCLPNSPVWFSTVPISSEAMSKMLSRFQVVREIQEAFLYNMQPVFG